MKSETMCCIGPALSGCCGGFRRFKSAKEELEELEAYKEELKKELAGIEEHVQKLRGK
jgi:hypothetical protein